jgi:hypothetical protein
VSCAVPRFQEARSPAQRELSVVSRRVRPGEGRAAVIAHAIGVSRTHEVGMNIFYIIGVIAAVLATLGFLSLG